MIRPPALTLFFAFAFAGLAAACQVPVFRYALERWETDSYVVKVFPRSTGEFSEGEQAAIDFLKKNQPGAENESGVSANLDLKIGEDSPGGEATAKSPENDSPAARMTVSYPSRFRSGEGEGKPIWEGPLTLENARRLVDSPARREIVKRLLGGQSAVWLLLESGIPAADDEAEQAVEKGMTEARQQLKIPDGVMTIEEAESAANPANVSPDDVLRSVVPLKIDFSVLRISRKDPAEAMFLPMLLHIEDDLGEFGKEPMVFPVFGRGRLLEPLIGKGVSADNTLDYSAYICGACSCEVKEQNPGQDLLIAADWWSALEGSEMVIDKILPPLEGTGILAQAAAPAAGEEEVSAEAAVAKPEEDTSAATPVKSGDPSVTVTTIGISPLILIGAALVVVLGVGTILILRKRPL